MGRIIVGDTVIPITYDYMQEAEPDIQIRPGFLSERKYKNGAVIGTLIIPETAITLERAKINGLVWWRIKTNSGIEGWVAQSEIIRINWLEPRKKQ